MLLFATFLTVAASSGDDSAGAGCFDLGCFFTVGSSAVSGFDRLDPPLAVSFESPASLGEDSTGRLDPRLLSFFTAGVLGFLAGAPFLTGVAFGGAEVSFFWTSFLAVRIAEDAPFLAGDFFESGRPLLLD